MILTWLLVVLSACGVAFSALWPGASDWLLLSVPCLLASLIILVRTLIRPPVATRPMVIVDGSNVMHWRDGTPRIETLREVVLTLQNAGLAPGVVFDANVGYKLMGRYLHDHAMGNLLGLPRDHVMIVPKGEPADPTILTAARDYDARIVTNDRFRDWEDSFPGLHQTGLLIRGGYRDGKLWLDL